MKALSRLFTLPAGLLVLVLIGAPSVYCASTQTVTAQGMAAVVDNNTAIAKDQAVNDALRKAIEQTVGTMIATETVVQNYQLLSDKIYSNSQGYIQNYKVINEQQQGNIYYTTIQATVGAGKLQGDLASLGILMSRKNMPRVMLMVAEQNIGGHYVYWWEAGVAETDMSVTENTLMQQLSEKGFNVVDPGVTSRSVTIPKAYRVHSLTNEAVQKVGVLYGAEIVIYGKALSKLAGSVRGSQMKSAQADISLRAVNIDTGRVIASVNEHGAAVHVSEETAGIEALKRTSADVADSLIEQIIARWSQDVSGKGLVKMVVSGIRDYKDFTRFKNDLKARVRGISNIYQRDVSGNMATLDIETMATAQDIADELSLIRFRGFSIKITTVTQSTIEVELVE